MKPPKNVFYIEGRLQNKDGDRRWIRLEWCGSILTAVEYFKAMWKVQREGYGCSPTTSHIWGSLRIRYRGVILLRWSR